MSIDFNSFKYFFSEKELEDKVFLLNGNKILLDTDLAEMFSVKPNRVRFIITRNKNIFVMDSFYKLNQLDLISIESQTNKKIEENTKYALTELGVLALISKLNSKRAIDLYIKYIRDLIDSKKINIWNELFKAADK